MPAFNPGPMTGAGNITWLIPGRCLVLIDAGTGNPHHLDALDGALGGERLAQVFVTHAHSDHASGAPALWARQPHVRFAKMPLPEMDARYGVKWEPLADGQHVEAGDDRLQVVHTPGHSPDHVCFWHAASRTLFCGDLVVQGSTVVIPASAGGDVAAYLASLQRVLALMPSRLLPAHGPVITDPAALLRSYISHRREREVQVLDALRAGAGTIESLVAAIYPDLSEALIPSARDTVTAHLLKLKKEGAVFHIDDEWRVASSRRA